MEWFRALSRRDRWLVVGLAVLTASQFMTWERTSGATIAMAGIGGGAPVFSSVATGSGSGASGWRVHSLALFAIPALFGAFYTSAKHSAFWRPWGTWITLALMLNLAWVDGTNAAGGGPLVGWVGVGIAALGVVRTRGVSRPTASS